MDPSRNLALHDAKVQVILQESASRQQGVSDLNTEAEIEFDMPLAPPPAYHSVIDPTNHMENILNHPEMEDQDGKEEDVPEININATTQIRGHGNIISIAQMDSMRIANLLAILVHGGVPPQGNAGGQQPLHPTQAQAQAPVIGERRHLPKININVNCGATVLGDRNIVGPGLGDIARHIQVAQQRQQQHQQQQQQQQQEQEKQQRNQTPGNVRMGQQQQSGFGFPVPILTPLATPLMSRSSSFGSDSSGGVKRKAEEEHELPVKKAH